MKRARFLYSLILVVGCCGLAQPQTAVNNPQAASSLSPEAMQVAQQIGVAPLLQQAPGDANADDHHLIESLLARQGITERLLGTSLEIDSTNSVIDLEIQQITSIRSDLESKRDRAQNVINVASLVTGGALGVVATALQFKASTANIGNGIGVAGGVTSVTLSLIGIHVQGGRRTLGDSPRMLAAFFGRTPNTPEIVMSGYPKPVWDYLNSAPPSQPGAATRKEQLIAKWRHEGRIEPEASPDGKQPKLDRATDNIFQIKRLNIDALNDRVQMLMDVRATLNLMKRDLSQILANLSATESTDTSK
jgi:hypothetical protein